MTTRRSLLITTGGIAAALATRPMTALGQPFTSKGNKAMLEITRAGAQASRSAPADYFTGTVRLDPVFPVREPGRVSAGHVTFEPGARTAWHTHPFGQTLIITSGLGWVQQEGGAIQEVRPGDVVWFPPGLKHWHGASATTAMSHFAIQETLNGKNVEWMEKVTDQQYAK